MAQESARSIALVAMREWRRGNHFADAILQTLLAPSTLSPADRAFATQLFYGLLRNLTLLDFWIALLRSGSLDHDSRDLVRLGLYQLLILRTPTHAAVFETVELATRRNRPLVNALLRAATRRVSELEQQASAAPLPTRTSHPEFLVERWIGTFGPSSAAALCEWDNQPAPIYARVNTLKLSAADFLARHADTEPAAAAAASMFARVPSIPMDALARGECYVQDPSTAAAVELLDPQPGETVLDACAAPGGKSGYIAALMQNTGELIACDREAARIDTLAGNLERLGVTIARVAQRDWTRPNSAEAFDPASFDRILLDAPCSNTGVLRRRIDARWRLRPNDFVRMPTEQLAIIRAVVPLLKRGGTFVYSTCSIEPEENEEVISQVLAEFPSLQLAATTSVLPFRDGFDGAFAARLVQTG